MDLINYMGNCNELYIYHHDTVICVIPIQKRTKTDDNTVIDSYLLSIFV